jgi:hypothetical protein
MTPKRPWVQLPTKWIKDCGLRALSWQNGGSANTAALMLLIAMTHFADESDGGVKLTYQDLHEVTWLSRTKISEGLTVLKALEVITSTPEARSTFQIVEYGVPPWGKLPAKGLYKDGAITPFSYFHLRHQNELRALKIFLLLVALRNNETNMAPVSYQRIHAGTGIPEKSIKAALNLLMLHGLIHIERFQRLDEPGTFTAYRIAHVDPYRHMGTIGRGDLIGDAGA